MSDDGAARILKGLQQWTDESTTAEQATMEAPTDAREEFAFAKPGSEPFPSDDPIERFRTQQLARSDEDGNEPRRRSTVRRLRSSIEALIDGALEKDETLRSDHAVTGE